MKIATSKLILSAAIAVVIAGLFLYHSTPSDTANHKSYKGSNMTDSDLNRVAQPALEEGALAHWRTYVNEEWGFRLQYPPGYQIQAARDKTRQTIKFGQRLIQVHHQNVEVNPAFGPSPRLLDIWVFKQPIKYNGPTFSTLDDLVGELVLQSRGAYQVENIAALDLDGTPAVEVYLRSKGGDYPGIGATRQVIAFDTASSTFYFTVSHPADDDELRAVSQTINFVSP